jgi:hypothetical protein
MQITGVSILFVEALLEGAVARGVDPAPLLRRAGVEPGAGRVSAQSYAALMKAVAQALDDEFFGRDSQRLKLGSFAMLCHAVLGCRTLRRALARAARFYNLMLDDTAATISEADGVLRLDIRSVRPVALFAHENLLLFLHRLAWSIDAFRCSRWVLPSLCRNALANIAWYLASKPSSTNLVHTLPSIRAMAPCPWCATRRR